MAHRALHAYVYGVCRWSGLSVRTDLPNTTLDKVLRVVAAIEVTDVILNGVPVTVNALHDMHRILV